LQTEPTDIIKACLKNDRRAQEILYNTCYEEMIRICMRYTAGEEELATEYFNEAMYKVFNNLSIYKSNGAFMGWVRTIMVNTCIDRCRVRVRFNVLELTESDDPVIEIPETYRRLSANDVMKLLLELPKNTGLVFNLFVMEGYKHNEIATILGISPGTSKWHLNEARKLLKIKLASLATKENLANAV
jgi:RNA polymerase sigma-70 factor, ECF subfamily